MASWIDDSLIFPGVKVYIDKLAEGFNLPPAIVIQNMMIRRIAEEDALNDVHETGANLLYEFMEEGGELVTGQDLYDRIYNMKRRELEQDRADQLQQLLNQYSDPVKFWEKMTDTDKDIMKRRGILPQAVKDLENMESKSIEQIKAEMMADDDDVDDDEWTNDL